jgi:G:T-mismatch repair DNA endonuclease (very short patch repair protein)
LYPSKFFYIISLVKVFEEFGVRFPVQRIKRMVEHQKKSNLTLYYFFLKFGKNEGKNRYNSYRSKQSYSNSVEYFVKKHGDKGYDIWERDRIKIEFAESKGFQVLVVWESEYKQNKLETIRRCNEFVNN